MEQWFQNTRGLVIIVLAVITGAVLLAIEPGDGFPTGTSSVSSGDGTTVTTTVTTLPQSTTTTVARPTLSEGTPDTGQTTVLQSRLGAWGYTVTVDGSFGPGTTTAVKQFQTDQKHHAGRRRRERGHVGRAPEEPAHRGRRHHDHRAVEADPPRRHLDATTAPVGTSAASSSMVLSGRLGRRRSVS